MTGEFVTYDRSFLGENGYARRTESERVDAAGGSVRIEVAPADRLAYVEAADPRRHREIVSELRRLGRGLDYCWFWNPDDGRVAVHRRYGENRWFVYDQSLDHAPGVRESKRAKLARVADGLAVLFDVRSVVDRFHRELWDVRLDLARALEAPPGVSIGDEERLLAAQRIVDRVLFCAFLVNADVIHGVDRSGDRFGLDPGALFADLLERGDLPEFLDETSFRYLGEPGWSEHRVGGGRSVAVPFLDAGVFRDGTVDALDGETVSDRDLDAGAFEWERLVSVLDRYDWRLGRRSIDGGSVRDERRELSPAVLGHLYERFALTVSELADEGALSLDALRETGADAGGERPRRGNRAVGAYYTPPYIAVENTREALWNRLRARVDDDPSVEGSLAGVDDVDDYFARARSGGTTDLPPPSGVGDVLAEFTVADPAVGNGAFLVTAGEILEEWLRRCDPSRSRYEVRNALLEDALYGVDLLDGAVGVCKLRLWLWLLSAADVDLSGGDPTVDPLPNVDANVRQGNSLVGLTAADAPDPGGSVEWVDGTSVEYADALDRHRRACREYRSRTGPGAEELRDRLDDQREALRAHLDRAFARASDARVEDPVASFEAFRVAVADATGRVKLVFEFDSPMTDEERDRVADAGFREQRNWTTTTYHRDAREADPEAVRALFESLGDRVTARVERPLRAADVATVDPFHWCLEFPAVFAPSGDGPGSFDVVVGNPPHGSSVGPRQKAILEDAYSLVERNREVAKVFTERSWTLADGDVSFVVPKASTYNSNWEDFRAFCLPRLYRGVDLGKAFDSVDHEQVTVHLSTRPGGDHYVCGTLAEGDYRLAATADVERAFAADLGTLPVSLAGTEQAVVSALADASLPTLGDLGIDAGRGASKRERTDGAEAPVAYNGGQVQRYFTRAAVDRIDPRGVSGVVRERTEAPKVMTQNILAHRKHPYDHVRIAAAYDPSGVYTFETVTNVLPGAESHPSLPALALLLNSSFVNWFVHLVLFNRAVRDMHLDNYFLERLALPAGITDAEDEALASLYGLLSAAAVATEYDLYDGASDDYRVLQNVANGATYALYLREVDAGAVETDLLARLVDELGARDVEFEPWLASHLECASAAEIERTFEAAEGLRETVSAVVDAVSAAAFTEALRAVAEHPWIAVVERGDHHPGEDGGHARPQFGPTKR